MLSPKRTKYQKYQKGRCDKTKQNMPKLSFGQFGIKAGANYRLTARTIEAMRRVVTRKLKRMGKVWVCVFPDIGVSKKPAEVRMGKGKGSLDHWIARIAIGHTLFEIDGVSKQQAFEAFELLKNKLPFPISFVSQD
jgi:large subunit ribosomal protein L16